MEIIQNSQKKTNYNNAYNGLIAGRLKIKKMNNDDSLYCVFNNGEYLSLYYDELVGDDLKVLNEIIKKNKTKIIDGEIICSVEDFYKNFKTEEIATLITLVIEACDCMCSYQHYSNLLKI